MKNYKKIYAAVALLSLACSSLHASTIVISDGTFDPADYEVQLDGSSANTSFSSTGTQIPIGGNPGSFRQVTNNAVGRFGGADFEIVRGWHFNIAQPYEPSTGAIVSLDYSEDSLLVFGATHEGRLALRQGGILYRTESSFQTGASNTQFSNNQFTALTADDFEGFFNGVFFPTANPDFSTSGGTIEFGFLRTFSSNQNFNNASGIDNWTVTLNTEVIPEPSAALLASLGALGLVFRRKKV